MKALEYLCRRVRCCRHCDGYHAPLFAFGKRHYTHPECGLYKHGVKLFAKLTPHDLDLFPASAARRFGLTADLAAAKEARKKALDFRKHAVAN